MPHHRSELGLPSMPSKSFRQHTLIYKEDSRRKYFCVRTFVDLARCNPPPLLLVQLGVLSFSALNGRLVLYCMDFVDFSLQNGGGKELLRSPLLMKAKTMTNAIILGASRPEDRGMNPPIHAHLPFTIPSIYFNMHSVAVDKVITKHVTALTRN